MSLNEESRNALVQTDSALEDAQESVAELERNFRNALPEDLRADYDLIQATKKLLLVVG